MNKHNLDALALEYQRDYGNAGSYFDTFDFVNQAFFDGKGSVFSVGFSEKFLNFPLSQLSMFKS